MLWTHALIVLKHSVVFRHGQVGKAVLSPSGLLAGIQKLWRQQPHLLATALFSCGQGEVLMIPT